MSAALTVAALGASTTMAANGSMSTASIRTRFEEEEQTRSRWQRTWTLKSKNDGPMAGHNFQRVHLREPRVFIQGNVQSDMTKFQFHDRKIGAASDTRTQSGPCHTPSPWRLQPSKIRLGRMVGKAVYRWRREGGDRRPLADVVGRKPTNKQWTPRATTSPPQRPRNHQGRRKQMIRGSIFILHVPLSTMASAAGHTPISTCLFPPRKELPRDSDEFVSAAHGACLVRRPPAPPLSKWVLQTPLSGSLREPEGETSSQRRLGPSSPK